MSRINGFDRPNKDLIEAMNKTIKHEGLYDSVIYVDNLVSLGYVYFSTDPNSVNDLLRCNGKVASNEEGTIYVVFDGEIYNSENLKSHLVSLGHSFKTNLDMELVIHAYEEYGLNFTNKLDGIWALAIYDKEEHKIILSRDIFGARPLYYFADGSRFIFSSEVKGIFEHEIDRIPNDQVIFDYLVFIWLNDPEETFFKGVKEVLPGNYVIFSLKDRELTKKRYYSPTKQTLKETQSVSKDIRSLLVGSISRKIKKSYPNAVGSCLSGGMDSSTIVCLTRNIFPKVDTHVFSLTFPGKVDESLYQEAVINKAKLKWHRISFTGHDLLKELYNLVYVHEFPIENPSCFGQYLVFKKAHDEGFKVLLDGLGGDGLFAGLPWVFGYYLNELLRGLKLKKFLKELKAMAKIYGIVLPLKQFVSVALVNFLSRVSPTLLTRLFWRYRGCYVNEEFLKKYSLRSRETLWKASTLEEILNNEGIGPLKSHPRYADRNSSYVGVQLRFPFLDRTLMEYCLNVPSELKIGHGVRKAILREAMKEILPKQVLERTDKMGFDVPTRDLSTEEEVQKFVLDIINSEKFKKRNYWNWKRVHEMFTETISGKKDWSSDIWKIIFLELWLRIWIENSKLLPAFGS